jgi:hypothetical protein
VNPSDSGIKTDSVSILTDTGRRSITNTEGPCEVCQGPVRHRHGSCTRPLPNRPEFPPWHFSQHHQPRPYYRTNGGVNKGRGGRGRGRGRSSSIGPRNTPPVQPTPTVTNTDTLGAIQLPANLAPNLDQPTPTTDASPKSPISDPNAFALIEAQFQAFNNHDNLPTSMDM